MTSTSIETEIPVYRLEPVTCIKRGYELFSKSPGLMIGATLLIFVLQIVGARVPGVGTFISVAIAPVLWAGFFAIAARISETGDATLDDGIKAIRGSQIDQLMLLGLVQTILVGIGFALLVIPGIYLMVAYLFSTLYAFRQRLNFWEAMEKSRRVITREWFTIFGLVLLLALLNLLGALAFGIGIVVTFPISLCAVYVAWGDVTRQIEAEHTT